MAVQIHVFDSPDALALALARRVAGLLSDTPDLVLGLAAGRTFTATYGELGALQTRGEADFSHCTTFLLDEFVGLPTGHAGSLRSEIERDLVTRVNLDRARTHFLDGTAADPDAECARYERVVERSGSIGLQLLGIGTNGHIGFNEPAEGLIARTHRAMLTESTRQDNVARFGGDLSAVPHEALTMGVGTILKAEAIVLAATGDRKAVAVARAAVGPVTARLPASLLQLHRRVELFLDWPAASKLPPQIVSAAKSAPLRS